MNNYTLALYLLGMALPVMTVFIGLYKHEFGSRFKYIVVSSILVLLWPISVLIFILAIMIKPDLLDLEKGSKTGGDG